MVICASVEVKESMRKSDKAICVQATLCIKKILLNDFKINISSDKISIRRKTRRANFLRRNFRAANCPYVEVSYGEISFD